MFICVNSWLILSVFSVTFYIYKKGNSYEARFNEKNKYFNIKKYSDEYNAKFKAVEYLEQLKEELKESEEKKQQQKKQLKQPTHCKCGDPFGPLKRCFFCGDYIF